MGVKFGTEEGTHRCNVSPLRGEKPQNRPLSKLNTGAYVALRAMLPVTRWLYCVECPKFCSERIHRDIGLRVLCKSREIWPTGSRQSRALLIWQKTTLSSGSSALATAQIATEICQASPRECTHSAQALVQIGSLSAELFPKSWTPLKLAVKCFQHSA